MLKIGEFSKIFNVTIKTIRFYEKKELLKPYYIDKYSGYRYYNEENIKQMNKILYLKKLGFSLDEIKTYDKKAVTMKIEEYQEKIIQYTSNINILKDINQNRERREKKKLKFNGYYKKDYRIIGFWKTIDMLKKEQKFKFRDIHRKENFEIKGIVVSPIGNEIMVSYANNKSILVKYTKNFIFDIADKKLISNYEYKKVNGKEYLFVEWKEQNYYILEKRGGVDFMEEMFENEERIYDILSKEGNGLTLGKNIILPEDKRGNVNTLIVGGSGAGKSSAYIIPNVLKMLGSYIIVDPLGEIYDKTHKYLKDNGYKIKVLNYKNRLIKNIDKEDEYQYNPIKHIKSDSDIENLANIIVGDDGDEFWNDASKSLIKAIIYYVIENESKKDLLTCFKLLGLPRENLFANFDIFEENTKAYKYYTILKTFPEKTYQSIVSTAILKLSFVINGIEEDENDNDELDFEKLREEKIAVFLMMNENHNEDIKFNNIFISQFLATYSVENIGKEHIYMILDEFGRIGKIYGFIRNLELARSRKMSISLITNNIENIKEIYGMGFYNLMNSIDTQLLLGTSIKSDIMYFSELLGIDPEFIKDDLKFDELLIYEKGLRPILAEKDYFFMNEDWVNIL